MSENATRLSIKLLLNIAEGRGGSLPYDIVSKECSLWLLYPYCSALELLVEVKLCKQAVIQFLLYLSCLPHRGHFVAIG